MSGAPNAEYGRELRVAEATVAMLADALIEFHDFVSTHIDLNPAPVEDYLAWPAERITELRKVLDERAHIDGSGGAS